jgi:hypothetical protein
MSSSLSPMASSLDFFEVNLLPGNGALIKALNALRIHCQGDFQ